MTGILRTTRIWNVLCTSQKNNNLKTGLKNKKKINEGVQINHLIKKVTNSGQ